MNDRTTNSVSFRYTREQLEEMERRDGPDLLADLAEAALRWWGEETDETRYKLFMATALYWRAHARRDADETSPIQSTEEK